MSFGFLVFPGAEELDLVDRWGMIATWSETMLSVCTGAFLNSARAAMKISGVNKVHAIMGGFHFAPHAPDDPRQTALAVKQLNPDCLSPMHCSGETFIAIAQQELGDKMIGPSTGTRFVFGASRNLHAAHRVRRAYDAGP